MKIGEYNTAGLSEMKIFPLPCCRHPFMSGSKWAVSAKLRTKLAWKECQVFPGVSFCLASFSWHRKRKWVRSWALNKKREVWVYKQAYNTFYYGILSALRQMSPFFSTPELGMYKSLSEFPWSRCSVLLINGPWKGEFIFYKTVASLHPRFTVLNEKRRFGTERKHQP